MSGDAATRPDIPAGPLVMPQDEFEMVRWVFELTGGPAFPANAATACRIAARMNAGGNGEVFRRLAEAIDGAKPGGPPSLGALRTWLECSGWTEQPPGSAGSIWVKGSARVAVTTVEDPLLVEGAVTRLAAATGRSVADMTALIVRGEVPALSATCTGCGEQFADSETDEYEFASRERMNKLLRADGWTANPVLCPACQEEEPAP